MFENNIFKFRKLLLPLDIQYFADGDPEPPVDPVEPAPAGGTDPQPPAPPVTYTEEDFQKRLQEELAKAGNQHKEQLEAALSEAQKLAKMNADEKAKYELEKREQDLAAKEKDIASRELRAETLKTLADPKYNLPAEVIDLVLADDAETTTQKMDTFKKVFDTAVQSAVETRLAGKSPTVGTGQTKVSTEEQAREQFAKALGGSI